MSQPIVVLDHLTHRGIQKVDQSGNQLLVKKLGSSSSDSGVNLIKDSNDDNIITGNYNG